MRVITERGDRILSMAEDTQVDGEKTGGTNSSLGERLMWKGTGRVAGNERMVGRGESHVDQKGVVNGRHMVAGERRKEE